jgi:hypothetical protein
MDSEGFEGGFLNVPRDRNRSGKIQRPGPDAPGGPRTRRNCDVCGEEFWPRVADVEAGKGRHCSSNCSSKALRRPKEVRCIECQSDFQSTTAKAKFCCKVCREKRTKKWGKCLGCGCRFPSAGGKKFHSRECAQAYAKAHRTAKASIGGAEFTVDEIAETLGISRETVRQRLQESRQAGLPDASVLRARGKSPGWQGRQITHAGETLSISGWAKKIGISQVAMSRRLRRMSVEEALSRPKQQNHHAH